MVETSQTQPALREVTSFSALASKERDSFSWTLISSRLACRSAICSSIWRLWPSRMTKNFLSCGAVSRGPSLVSMISLASVQLRPQRLARSVSLSRVRSRAL